MPTKSEPYYDKIVARLLVDIQRMWQEASTHSSSVPDPIYYQSATAALAAVLQAAGAVNKHWSLVNDYREMDDMVHKLEEDYPHCKF